MCLFVSECVSVCVYVCVCVFDYVSEFVCDGEPFDKARICSVEE